MYYVYCVCMYLCMYVCMYVCMYIYYTHTYFHILNICINLCVYEFVCVYVDELMKVYRFVTHHNSTMYPPDKEHIFAVFTFVPS